MANLSKKSDVMSGLAILLFCGLGLFFIKNVHGFPSAFPIVTLSCMGILALVLIVKTIRKRPKQGSSTGTAAHLRTKEEVKTLNAEPGEEPGVPDVGLIFGLLTITVLYIVAMGILGFTISTFIYLFMMLRFLGMRRYGVIILISTLTTAGIFVIFRTIMYIGLPAGIFDPTQFLYKLLSY